MPAQRSEDLQWVSLQDFTPGIWNRSNYALSGVAVPAPLGAAQETNTYRCIALPGGGLGPLPKRVTSWSISAPEASAPQSGYWIPGFFVMGRVTTGVGSATPYEDAIFVPVAYQIAAGSFQYFRLYRIQAFSSPVATDTIKSMNSTWNGNDFYEPATFMSSRMNTTDPTLPGTPIVGVTWATPGGAAGEFVSTFPDPSTSNVTAMADLSTTRWGDVLGHQGRLVLLESAGYSFGAVGGMATNEQISFSDPPNSFTLGSQQEVFVQESPNGYGAWGSISAGELFLVKNQGGGVIISGDIAFPSVTRLPGVVSAGGMRSNRAASTPSGLFYGVLGDGCYVWRGGDTSQKVSPQLSDDFLGQTNWPKSAVSVGQFSNAGLQASFASWGTWVVATNNWLFDTLSSSWWRIEDPSLVNMVYWSKGYIGQFMYGAPSSFTQSAPTVAYTWDKATPSLSWSWQSHAIPATIDRLTEVREMVLAAQGSGTVTVTMTGINPAGATTTQAEAFTVSHADQPQRLRPSVGGTFIKGYNVMVRIESSGSAAAPVVYSVQLGTRPAQQVVAT